MNRLDPSAKVYLSESTIENAGRGVFAAQDIAEGQSIEICPVVVFYEHDVEILKQTQLLKYYFIWGEKLDEVAICLGFGSLYNHSYEPNATYIKKFTEAIIEFVALTPIRKDEEILTNYNQGNRDDKSRLWLNEIKPAKEG